MQFILHWVYPDPSTRHEGFEGFGKMPAGDDVGDGGAKIKLVGRWHSVTGIEGFLVCETDSADALASWATNWNSILDITITPCLEDKAMKAVSREFFG